MNSIALRHPGMMESHYQVFPVNSIPENTSGVRAASFIPYPISIWGNSVFEVACRSLNERMTQTTHYTPALVRLIEIKNELMNYNTAGNFICTAVMTVIVASSILSGAAFFSYFIPLLIGLAAANKSVENLGHVGHNKNVIAELQMTGFRNGMTIQ